jgi:tetratricopeptide (TPR) repeat protein
MLKAFVPGPEFQCKKISLALLLLILVHVGLHLKYVPLPPGGFHLWRQTQGLAVARNFQEEGMNILKPRVDNRGNLSGITGMEFPLVNFLAACHYKVFGFSHAGSRLVILFFSVAAIVFCFLFFRQLLADSIAALMTSFCLAFSPLFGYYALVMLPDVPMLAWLFASLFFLRKWAGELRWPFLFWALLCLAMAGMLKISALFVALYFMRVICQARKGGNTFWRLASLALALLLVLLWYLYAMHLSGAYGNFDFRLNPEWQRGLTGSLEVLVTVFFKWLPGFFVSVIQLPLLLLGLVVLARQKGSAAKDFTVFFLAGFLAYAGMFYPMFTLHDYYMIPALPLLVLGCALGMRALLKTSQKRKHVFWALWLLLVVMVPLAGSLRYIWRFEDRSADRLHRLEIQLDRILPDKGQRLMVGCEDSPSVYLYFFHRRGWTIRESLGTREFERMVVKGASHLVCDSRKFTSRPEIRRRLEKIASVGGFTVYRLLPLAFDWRFSVAGDFIHFVPNDRISNAGKLLAALSSSPRRREQGLFTKGLELEVQKAYAQASSLFSQEIRLHAKNARAWFHLGYCYGMMGRHADEIDAYLQAIARQPADALSFFNLAFVLASADERAQAEDVFRRPEMAAADPFLKNYYLGMIQGACGENEMALASYRQAMHEKADHPLLLRNLGAIYGKLGRSREAVEVLTRAAGLGGDRHLARFQLALAFLQQGALAAAGKELDSVLRAQPGHGPANFYLGLLCLLRNDLARSRSCLLASRSFAPRGNAACFFLGVLELLECRPRQAMGEYRELRRRDKDAAMELLNLIYMAGQGEIRGDSLVGASLRAYAALAY